MSITNSISEAGINQNNLANKLKNNNLSEDSFMTLLLAQLKMQSPTNPFDSTAMMQQISQMTTLMSTKGLEKSIGRLTDHLGASQVIQASDLIGKRVQVPNDRSALVEGEGLSGAVIVPEGVEAAVVTIRDSNNNIVKTLPVNASGKGMADFKWDGLGENNMMCSPGLYQISASTTIQGEQVDLATAGTFKVSSVALNQYGSGPILNAEGLNGIGMDDIIKII